MKSNPDISPFIPKKSFVCDIRVTHLENELARAFRNIEMLKTVTLSLSRKLNRSCSECLHQSDNICGLLGKSIDHLPKKFWCSEFE